MFAPLLKLRFIKCKKKNRLEEFNTKYIHIYCFNTEGMWDVAYH